MEKVTHRKPKNFNIHYLEKSIFNKSDIKHRKFINTVSEASESANTTII